MASASAPLLVMSGVTKDFTGGRVLHGVDFSLRSGEVHAVVGHNGAGKSTLVKILGGVYTDYGGLLEIQGRSVVLHEPRDAIEEGVAIIHQDFMLVPFFTVAQNIALGQEPSGRVPGSVSLSNVRRMGLQEVAALQIDLPTEARIAELGVAAQQLTEIVKAVSRRARILVMDEPTARLSRTERDHLFAIIRDLKAGGAGVIYISHFLEEIFDIADRVTVLRDGRVVHAGEADKLDLDQLTHLVAGARLEVAIKRRESSNDPRSVALRLVEFGVEGRVGPVDLEIARGEIVGLAGLVGSGRTTLGRALVGTMGGIYGSISVGSWTGVPRSPTQAARKGILLLTEDRKREGIIGVRPMGENVIATALGRLKELVALGLVRRSMRNTIVDRVVSRLDIVPADPGRPATTFSGGNQQKVLFARAIAAAAPVLILDQPTAGVDVGAKADLYEQIDQLARSGIAIILISDDLDELLALCDRIAIVRRGRLEAVRPADSFDRPELLRAITVGAGDSAEVPA